MHLTITAGSHFPTSLNRRRVGGVCTVGCRSTGTSIAYSMLNAVFREMVYGRARDPGKPSNTSFSGEREWGEGHHTVLVLVHHCTRRNEAEHRGKDSYGELSVRIRANTQFRFKCSGSICLVLYSSRHNKVSTSDKYANEKSEKGGLALRGSLVLKETI